MSSIGSHETTQSPDGSPSFWRPAGLAAGVALAATFVPAALAGVADSTGVLGEYSWEWANGAGRLVVTLLALWVLHRRGWLSTAGLTSRLRPSGLTSLLGALAMVGALVPMVGLFSSSWEARGAIAAYVWFYGLAGPFEEIVFRGLIFVALALAWPETEHGVRRAAIVASALFAVLHLHPVAIAIVFTVGLALAGLMVVTRSIWPCILAHSAYDIFAQFPLDPTGAKIESEAIGTVIALPFLLAAAILAWRLLGQTPSIVAAMTDS